MKVIMKVKTVFTALPFWKKLIPIQKKNFNNTYYTKAQRNETHQPLWVFTFYWTAQSSQAFMLQFWMQPYICQHPNNLPDGSWIMMCLWKVKLSTIISVGKCSGEEAVTALVFAKCNFTRVIAKSTRTWPTPDSWLLMDWAPACRTVSLFLPAVVVLLLTEVVLADRKPEGPVIILTKLSSSSPISTSLSDSIKSS